MDTEQKREALCQITSQDKKKHFPRRVIKHWHRLPRAGAEAPSLKMFKTWLDTVLGNPLQVTLVQVDSWTRWSPEMPSKLCHGLWSSERDLGLFVICSPYSLVPSFLLWCRNTLHLKALSLIVYCSFKTLVEC